MNSLWFSNTIEVWFLVPHYFVTCFPVLILWVFDLKVHTDGNIAYQIVNFRCCVNMWQPFWKTNLEMTWEIRNDRYGSNFLRERERERERERGYAYVYVYIQCVILELIILFSYYRIINSWYKKPVLNLYFRFEFFIYILNNSLCTSLIIRLKLILMIDAHKMWLDIRENTNLIM